MPATVTPQLVQVHFRDAAGERVHFAQGQPKDADDLQVWINERVRDYLLPRSGLEIVIVTEDDPSFIVQAD